MIKITIEGTFENDAEMQANPLMSALLLSLGEINSKPEANVPEVKMRTPTEVNAMIRARVEALPTPPAPTEVVVAQKEYTELPPQSKNFRNINMNGPRIKDSIMEFIKRSPGTTVPKIQENLGYSKQQVMTALKSLKIRRQRDPLSDNPRTKLIFPMTYVHNGVKHNHSQIILDYVRNHPGQTAMQISTALGVPINSASARVTMLFKENLLKREGIGGFQEPYVYAAA
jgi:hypothetical protein